MKGWSNPGVYEVNLRVVGFAGRVCAGVGPMAVQTSGQLFTKKKKIVVAMSTTTKMS